MWARNDSVPNDSSYYKNEFSLLMNGIISEIRVGLENESFYLTE